ncbi:hypothetical protein HUJ04_010652 [Dendroctonus ponderosae]|nr:hypothetical protein HUJ04_010652 [Dendroctonus ponderosae]
MLANPEGVLEKRGAVGHRMAARRSVPHANKARPGSWRWSRGSAAGRGSVQCAGIGVRISPRLTRFGETDKQSSWANSPFSNCRYVSTDGLWDSSRVVIVICINRVCGVCFRMMMMDNSGVDSASDHSSHASSGSPAVAIKQSPSPPTNNNNNISNHHHQHQVHSPHQASPLGPPMSMAHPLSPPPVSSASLARSMALSHLPPPGLGLLNSLGVLHNPLDLMAHHGPPRSYNSPPPISTSDPTANECKLVDYRGQQVAAFIIAGDTMLCLPQAFELFLKHLVGGLHTVYTKLKRLDIVPLVCNVEQVRILRGLGAIQPGVNRCKLLSCKDFDTLYKDCTTARFWGFKWKSSTSQPVINSSEIVWISERKRSNRPGAVKTGVDLKRSLRNAGAPATKWRHYSARRHDSGFPLKILATPSECFSRPHFCPHSTSPSAAIRCLGLHNSRSRALRRPANTWRSEAAFCRVATSKSRRFIDKPIGGKFFKTWRIPARNNIQRNGMNSIETACPIEQTEKPRGIPGNIARRHPQPPEGVLEKRGAVGHRMAARRSVPHANKARPGSWRWSRGVTESAAGRGSVQCAGIGVRISPRLTRFGETDKQSSWANSPFSNCRYVSTDGLWDSSRVVIVICINRVCGVCFRMMMMDNSGVDSASDHSSHASSGSPAVAIKQSPSPPTNNNNNISNHHHQHQVHSPHQASPLGPPMSMAHPLSPPPVSSASLARSMALSHLPPPGLGLLNSLGVLHNPLDLMAHHGPPRSYNSPPPISTSDPTANECKLVDYRGQQVAAFIIAGDTMLCLPQAFELFLKHLVGGLHTVYTKLKRLDIVPLVCNVEQVRILRGLGAIQPGVNRCKLLSCKDFDTLYKDCTTARIRNGLFVRTAELLIGSVSRGSSPRFYR